MKAGEGQRAAPSGRRSAPPLPSAAPFPVPSEHRFSPDALRLDGFGKPEAEIFADLADGAQSCPVGTPAPFFLLRRSGEVNRLPVSEGRGSELANPACDLQRLVVSLTPHCFLHRRP